MKDFNYYSENKLDYPSWKVSCSCGKHISKSKNLNTKFCSDCGTNIEDIYNTENEKHKKAIKDYNNESSKRHNEFIEDLFEEFDVENNEKRYKCFSIAWDRGHSYGYYEVYNCFQELVELII